MAIALLPPCGQGHHFLTTRFLRTVLSLLILVAVNANVLASTPTDQPQACVDDNAKWEAFGTTCAKMKWQCDVPGYSAMVRKWCPRTCGICSPSPAEDDGGSVTDDIIALTTTGYETTSLELTLVRKSSANNTSAEGQSPLRNNGSSIDTSNSTAVEVKVSEVTKLSVNSSTIAGSNSTRVNESILLESTDVLQITHDPPTWKITLPSKDAVIDVSSKASAYWSLDEEHFVFELSNDSSIDKVSEDDNVSTEALEADGLANTGALQEEEDMLCPDGYEKVVGHVYGGDQYGKGYNLFASSIKECARWCTQSPGCGSFEYSNGHKRCFRNSQTRPTALEERQGYILCRRAPCPSLLTEAACVGPAVTPGWLSAEVKLRPGSYCIWSAGRCQAPMACTYEDCFLPDGGLPGMELPLSKTLWISRSGLMATMAQKPGFL